MNKQDLIEELSLTALEQRIEFSCCGGGGDDGGDGGDHENPDPKPPTKPN